MKKNLFFKPTPLYKEYAILDYLFNNRKITQRRLSLHLAVSISMVNKYIREYEECGYIYVEHLSTKNVNYSLTDKGRKRLRYLNFMFFDTLQKIYNGTYEYVKSFFFDLSTNGFRRIVFYGAGDVAFILLKTITENPSLKVDVLGVIDDDVSKQGTNVFNVPVLSFNELSEMHYDGILVSSYANSSQIFKKILFRGIEEKKIIRYF